MAACDQPSQQKLKLSHSVLLTILKSQGSEAMRSDASFGRNAVFATGSRDCDSNLRSEKPLKIRAARAE